MILPFGGMASRPEYLSHSPLVIVERSVHGPAGIDRAVASLEVPSAGRLVDIPDWRDLRAYDWLRNADPIFFAWEWLRRNSVYREEALASPARLVGREPRIILEQKEASKWGLHAFEDPRCSSDARPLWLASHDKSVLRSKAVKATAESDCFSLGEVSAMATIGIADDECRLLLCQGHRAVRMDVEGREILASDVLLQFHISGFAAARQSLRTWERLKRLAEGEALPPLSLLGLQARRRQLLLLRTFDAMVAGASQRQIAAVLIHPEAAGARWRSVNPSLRSQAQRLVKGARAHAQGRFWSILD